MKNVLVAMCLLFALTACNSGGVEKRIAWAQIFERKTMPGNKLQVSYRYQKGAQLVNDSAVIDNKILPQDSVPVNMLQKATNNNP